MTKIHRNNQIKNLSPENFPKLLKEIPDQPKKLFLKGSLPPEEDKILCVVGSRKNTEYGKEVCQKLISKLQGYKITIISGLALGIDAIAHRSALKAGLNTLAVPGSGLNSNVLYPRTNRKLAEEIIEKGGGLVSEFSPEMKADIWTFPQRNRIMAGISDAVLVIEATNRSGTLITARLALDYNREVLAVPGSLLSPNSVGTNMLIKSGAVPVTESEDILEVLGIERENREEKADYSNFSEEEKQIIEALREPMDKNSLIRKSGMDASKANIILSTMEIKGIIKESLGKIILND